MKANYTLFFLFILMLSACQKEDPVTRPVEFPETTYQNLGTYDDMGKPNYLLGRDAISSGMLDHINSMLPERTDLRQSHPELLNTSAVGDIDIIQSSDVYITFVFQGTAMTGSIAANSFAFYTYPTNQPPASPKDIKTIIYAFPSAGSSTPLQPGDKIKIGRFNPGTSIGFVLLQSAWKPDTKTVNNKAVHFCSNDVLNPEVDPKLKKHAVLFNYVPENKVLIGFEDLDRTTAPCDHDFNDLILYATITP